MLWEQAVYVQYPSFPNYPGDFLFFSTHVFFFIRWDYGVMETSAKYLQDAQVEHARLSMQRFQSFDIFDLGSSQYPSRGWKSLENLETPRVHRW